MLFNIAFIVFILYWLFVYTTSHDWVKHLEKAPSNTDESITVSVLISARNESKQILKTLTSLSQQSYGGHWEVILINDHSTDDTLALAQAFDLHNLTVVDLEEHVPPHFNQNSYKKLALKVGLAQSTGQLIIHTDADCTFNPEWIKDIVRVYQSKNAKCLVGPVIFENNNSLINDFQNLDIISMMVMTAYGVNNKHFYIGNGANLAYEREAFDSLNIQGPDEDFASGDDVFLIQNFASTYPEDIHYLSHPSALVTTRAETEWSALWRQRIRWSTKNKSYKNLKLQMVMGGTFVFSWAIIVLGLLSIFDLSYLIGFLILLVGKMLSDWVFFKRTTPYFGRRINNFIPVSILHILYIAFVGMASLFVRRYRWKDREVV